MDNDHGITDELREWSRDNLTQSADLRITAIADRIDAAYRASYQDGENAILAVFDKRGNADVDERMAEHGWVRLPRDADGEYWFCGDKIMLPDGNVVEVIGIGGDWLYYCMASVAITVFGRIRAHDKRHYEQPTVEDVLEELPREYGRDDSELTNGEIVERFAAKLRLAGDE